MYPKYTTTVFLVKMKMIVILIVVVDTSYIEILGGSSEELGINKE